MKAGLRIRVFGFRKIRVRLGKTRVGSGFGRTDPKFRLGIFGQLGHSAARVSSDKPERSDFSGTRKSLTVSVIFTTVNS